MKGIRQLLFVLFICIILYTFAMFQGGFVSWFMFFSFLPIFIYSIFLLIYPLKKWQITRDVSNRTIRAGDDILITVTINRLFPFPLYYCICEEAFPATLKKIDNRFEKYNSLANPVDLYTEREAKKIVFPWFKRVIHITYQLEKVPRGEHHLNEIKIKTGDIFGFIQKEHVFQVSERIKVYPNERLIKMNEQMSGFEHGPISSSVLHFKHANIASGIREYMPGDKLSWIDWKQTARKNKMMTKEFEQEKSTDTLIILDGCKYEGINLLAFEGMVEIVMSLVEALQLQHTSIGLLSIGAEVTRFPLHHDPTKAKKIREHLMQIQPTKKGTFSLRLKEEIMKMESQFVVMIVTTHIDAHFKQTLMHLRRRTRRIIVFLITSANRMTAADYEVLQDLQYADIAIHLLTEKEMIKQSIEVNM